MYDYLKQFAKRNLIPKRVANFLFVASFVVTVLINLFKIGKTVETSLSYLQQVPAIRSELVQLKQERTALRDSLCMFRNDMMAETQALSTRMDGLDDRIGTTNQSVKVEFKKMNDYFIILSSSNAEIKRLMMIKKETDNILYEQMFPSNYSFKY